MLGKDVYCGVEDDRIDVHGSNWVGATFYCSWFSRPRPAPVPVPESVDFVMFYSLTETFKVLLTTTPIPSTRATTHSLLHGHPGSENVGNGLVDAKQPPYVLPQLLMESTHIVGTAVVVTGFGVVMAVLVVGCVVVSSEQDGPVKVGQGLVEGKQPP